MVVCFSNLGQNGRLGNILFQAAATIALALRNNDIYQFPKYWKERIFFNIPEENFVDKLYFSETYNEPYYHYSPIRYKKNINISGYYQNWLYFEDYKNEIKKLLTPNIKIEKQNYTSIHVRRTDYLTHKNCYHILDRNNYYDKAMLISGDNKFLIFSDDLKWCKENFTGNEFNFAEENSAVYDLKLMSMCTNNIIANSSFSWWAAYLNNNSNKQIIYPRLWFGPELNMNNTKDLFLPDWIRV